MHWHLTGCECNGRPKMWERVRLSLAALCDWETAHVNSADAVLPGPRNRVDFESIVSTNALNVGVTAGYGTLCPRLVGSCYGAMRAR